MNSILCYYLAFLIKFKIDWILLSTWLEITGDIVSLNIFKKAYSLLGALRARTYRAPASISFSGFLLNLFANLSRNSNSFMYVYSICKADYASNLKACKT